MTDYILETKNLGIDFGGLTAVNNFDIKIGKNDIYGLIGPNGAGKTTCFNAMTGGIKKPEGDIKFEGKSVLGKNPREICYMGISRTYQNIRLFSNMTTLQNVEIGLHAKPQYSRLAAALNLPKVKKIDKECTEQAFVLLEKLGIEKYADLVSGNLPYGIQRKLEIARALATNPRFLLLDEPAAGMNNDECAELVDLLKMIHKDFDLTTIIIEHHMDLVVSLCDRICVLNLGHVLALDEPSVIQNNPEVIRAYLGNRRNSRT